MNFDKILELGKPAIYFILGTIGFIIVSGIIHKINESMTDLMNGLGRNSNKRK